MKKSAIVFIIVIVMFALCSCGGSSSTGHSDKELNEEIKNAYEAGYKYAVEEYNTRIAEDIPWDKVPSAIDDAEREGGFTSDGVMEYFLGLVDDATEGMKPDVMNYDQYTNAYEQ